MASFAPCSRSFLLGPVNVYDDMTPRVRICSPAPIADLLCARTPGAEESPLPPRAPESVKRCVRLTLCDDENLPRQRPFRFSFKPSSPGAASPVSFEAPAGLKGLHAHSDALAAADVPLATVTTLAHAEGVEMTMAAAATIDSAPLMGGVHLEADSPSLASSASEHGEPPPLTLPTPLPMAAARAASKSRAGVRTARTTQRGPKPATRVKKLRAAPKSRAAGMELRSALRARSVVPPKAGKWTAAEDEQLVQAIGKQQQRGKASERISWQAVAALVGGRCAKQCRERWCNQLRPGLNTQEWTAAEDAQLIDLVGRIGRKWSQVGRLLQTGRGDNAVKNRFAKLAHAGRAGADALSALAELLDEDEPSSGELGEDGGDAMDLDAASDDEEEPPTADFDAGQLELSSSQQAAAAFYADGTELELALALEDDGADEFSFLCCVED